MGANHLFYFRVNLAITNNLGDALFRGIAVCRIRDTNRTNPTSWVHGSSLPHKIYEKLLFPRINELISDGE